MSSAARKLPAAGVYLRLGRVSNLPTVWTNVLAGVYLGGGSAAAASATLPIVMAAVSACYVAGMYLNDAFDRAVDARERPERPIPAGEISAASVFSIGFALLALGLFGLALCGQRAGLAGAGLVATILVYDIWHKGNPASPLVMGACRALVYVAAAAAAGMAAGGAGALALAALAMLAHVAGLTYAAKQESLDRIGRLWPLALLALPLALYGWRAGAGGAAGLAIWAALALANAAAVRRLARRSARGAVPGAVAQLIAATALLDGVVMAAAGASPALVCACAGAYLCTRLLQRLVAGT
ncbi:UbiA family prenyltransferase [Massilia aquatica]|uniref:Prenyltransferase n=1 Tax=Massilia aquatica TaxID=2609000 RepID=A0ABX0MAW7_9BURK|nr:UbiA family prenyltransferase [Massilia aquatica]NHZ41625.1 prenyltransferase [Massilia aquatica]